MPKRKPKRCPRGTITQSIIFRKDKWNQRKAKEWLRKHGRLAGKVDETKTELRYRQMSPKACIGGFASIQLGTGSGVRSVICCPKG